MRGRVPATGVERSSVHCRCAAPLAAALLWRPLEPLTCLLTQPSLKLTALLAWGPRASCS